MENLEDDLKNLISNELIELAWYADYPLNLQVGLWAFLNAMQRGGFNLIPDYKRKRVKFNLSQEIFGSVQEFNAEISFEQILRGVGHRPMGSTHCLYDSIHTVHDIMEEGKFSRDDMSIENRDYRNDWSSFRGSNSRRIRVLMEEEMREYFEKYQEHLFIPLSGDIPKLKEPKLIYQILKKFPLNMFEFAETMKEAEFVAEEQGHVFNGITMVGSPCAETILEEGFNMEGYNPSYFPSETTLVDLFRGMYLQRLSQIKGYNTWSDSQDLREFVVRGIRAFKYGSMLEFPADIRNKGSVVF